MSKKVAKEKLKLTDSWIERQPLEATGRRYVYDSELTGFCLRITPKQKVFAIRVRVIENGKHVEKSYNVSRFNDPLNSSMARKQAQSLIAQLRLGSDPVREQREAAREFAAERAITVTIGEALEDYLRQSVKLGERSRSDYQYIIDHELAPYKDKRLTDIDVEWVRDTNAEIAKSGSRSELRTARATKAMKLVQKLCRYKALGLDEWSSIEWHKYVPKDPVLCAEDGIAIWNTLGNAYATAADAYMKVLMLTGCRRGELASVLVRNVNIRGRELTLSKTKNGKRHIIYMSDQMVEVIAPLLDGKEPDDKLFPGAGDPRKTLHRCHNAVGKKFGYHEFRKLFAVTCNRLDVPFPVLKGCLNHSVKSSNDITLAVYAKANATDMRVAWQKVSDYYSSRSGTISLNQIRRDAA